MPTLRIAPSIRASDFSRLGEEIRAVEAAGADWIHIDVMDGHFVPNLTIGPGIVEAARRCTDLPLDVHLMIEQPERYIKDFRAAGADILTVHLEASRHLHRSLQAIKAEGMKAGVALNPHSPVSLLKDVIQDCDLVCLMSVNPGFGGQSFIEKTYDKITELKAMIVAAGSNTLIEIDGGVNKDNAAALKAAGADVLVAGSAVFKADDPIQMIQTLQQAGN